MDIVMHKHRFSVPLYWSCETEVGVLRYWFWSTGASSRGVDLSCVSLDWAFQVHTLKLYFVVFRPVTVSEVSLIRDLKLRSSTSLIWLETTYQTFRWNSLRVEMKMCVTAAWSGFRSPINWEINRYHTHRAGGLGLLPWWLSSSESCMLSCK